MLGRDSDYFQELQSHTGWGRTLYGFASWCSPQPDWLILDVGCGPGLLPAIFSRFGCRAIGIDLDAGMFQPKPLHPMMAVASVDDLPFTLHTFNLITASNLVFLLPEPIQALHEMKRFLSQEGKLAMLNPSDYLNEKVAREFADQEGMEGLARESLLNWAKRAEEHHHWTEAETSNLYRQAGLKYMGSVLKVGPGFGRFSWGVI